MKSKTLSHAGMLRATFTAVAGVGLAGALVVVAGALSHYAAERQPEGLAQAGNRTPVRRRSWHAYFQSGDWRADGRTLAAMVRYLCEPEPSFDRAEACAKACPTVLQATNSVSSADQVWDRGQPQMNTAEPQLKKWLAADCQFVEHFH